MLEIRNLHARIAETGTEIIRGLNLTVKGGEVAAIMGPNGSGKSTLSYILAGREDYEVTEGDILYNGESILEMDPAERAAKGVFLAFQYPLEIPGVATMEFLKVALNAQRRARGEPELKIPDLMKKVREAAGRLEEKLAGLSRAPSAGPGLAKGRVAWPVQGVLRLGYGSQIDPEFGTATMRNGIEVAALEGSPVRAVARGRVLFAGWFRGYGQVVIVDHGSGQMTVSGYMEELAVRADQYVEADQVIGAVGETGSLSGPGLYFEIRKAGKPVDPQEWLE